MQSEVPVVAPLAVLAVCQLLASINHEAVNLADPERRELRDGCDSISDGAMNDDI